MARLAKVNAVLADANRLRLICLLKNRETCVCELWEPLALPQNLVSHHLKVLKTAGLIESRREKTRVYYKLNRSAVASHLKSLLDLTKPSL